MVAAAVANERRAGTLDQLRTTPLSPLALAAGTIVGVPARLYLLCAGPLGLHVVAALAGPAAAGRRWSRRWRCSPPAPRPRARSGCAVALAPRQESGGTFAALGVAALLGCFAFVTSLFAADHHLVAWSYLHPAGALDAVMLAPNGLWRRMVVGTWGGGFESEGYRLALSLVPLASVAASLVLGAMLLRAACRKLAAPQLPLFGKRQAVALFALTAGAVVAPLIAIDRLCDFDATAAYGFSMLLLPVVVVVGLFATPTFEAWALTVRGDRRVGWSSDDAAAHRAVWLMLALWAAAVVVLLGDHRWHGFGRRRADRHRLDGALGRDAAGLLPVRLDALRDGGGALGVRRRRRGARGRADGRDRHRARRRGARLCRHLRHARRHRRGRRAGVDGVAAACLEGVVRWRASIARPCRH